MSGFSQILSLSKRLSFRSLLAISATLLFGFSQMACTGEKLPTLHTDPGELPVQKALAGVGAQAACAPEELHSFERTELGVPIDLEREALPRGLFLAKVSELLIEKRTETQTAAQTTSRLLVREVVGSGRGAEIRCAENVEGFGHDFDVTMTGLVKFETSERPTGSGFVLRQFFFFQDMDGFGVVVSNPKLSSPIFDLKKLIRGGVAPGQLVRTGERSYLIRYVRERENGVRARLVIHLDLI